MLNKLKTMQEILDSATKLWREYDEMGAINILSEITNASGAANTLIGNMYACAQKGQSNIKRDYKKARKYYEKAVDLNDAEGALELAKIYFFGDGIKTNYDKAESLWEKAYSLGNETGAFELANYLYDYKPEKIEKAISIYKELISKGEFTGNCEFKLSRIYGQGIGTSKNLELELMFLAQGAKSLHFNCCRELAFKYFKGEDVEQNLEKALEIIEKADTRELFDKDKDRIIDLIKGKM